MAMQNDDPQEYKGTKLQLQPSSGRPCRVTVPQRACELTRAAR